MITRLKRYLWWRGWLAYTKPCAFCGGKIYLNTAEHWSDGNGITRYSCPPCSADFKQRMEEL